MRKLAHCKSGTGARAWIRNLLQGTSRIIITLESITSTASTLKILYPYFQPSGIRIIGDNTNHGWMSQCIVVVDNLKRAVRDCRLDDSEYAAYPDRSLRNCVPVAQLLQRMRRKVS